MRTVYTFCLTLLVATVAFAQYPVSALSRPLTTPRNMFETSLSFNNTRFAEVRIDWGVSNDIQVGLDWAGLSARGLTPSRQVGLHGAYALFESEYVRSKVNVDLPIFLQQSVLQEIGFSLPTYFAVIPEHLNVVLLEDLVTLGFNNEVNAQFRFPVRLFWQATRAFSLSLGTDLATVNTHASKREYADTHILETTPVRLHGLYAVTPEVDVFSAIGIANAQNATGISAALGVVVRTGVAG